jgi:hypothetical protein
MVENKLKLRSNLLLQSSSLTYKEDRGSRITETSVPTQKHRRRHTPEGIKHTNTTTREPVYQLHKVCLPMVRHGTFIEFITISKQVFHSHQHNAVQSQGSIRKVSRTIRHSIFFPSRRFFFYDAVNYELCVRMMWVVL